MLKDLYLYEIILLTLGSLLFLILSGILVYYVIIKEEIKKLLFFFPIAVLMIAYPGIKELNISSDKIELITYQERFENNPEDTVAKNKIEELTAKLTPRVHTEEDLILLGKSNVLLQKPKKALVIAEKVIEKNKEVSSEKSNDIYLKQAYQLKDIAEIQQEIATQKDAVNTVAKLENLKLDTEFTKISSVIKKRYLKRSKNNSN